MATKGAQHKRDKKKMYVAMSFMFQFPGNGKKWPRTQAKHGDVIQENVSHFFQTFSYVVSLEPLCSSKL